MQIDGYWEQRTPSRKCGYTKLSEVRHNYPEFPTLNTGTIRSPVLYKILLRVELSRSHVQFCELLLLFSHRGSHFFKMSHQIFRRTGNLIFRSFIFYHPSGNELSQESVCQPITCQSWPLRNRQPIKMAVMVAHLNIFLVNYNLSDASFALCLPSGTALFQVIALLRFTISFQRFTKNKIF